MIIVIFVAVWTALACAVAWGMGRMFAAADRAEVRHAREAQAQLVAVDVEAARGRHPSRLP